MKIWIDQNGNQPVLNFEAESRGDISALDKLMVINPPTVRASKQKLIHQKRDFQQNEVHYTRGRMLRTDKKRLEIELDLNYFDLKPKW